MSIYQSEPMGEPEQIGDLFHFDELRLATEWEACQWTIDGCDNPTEVKRAVRRQTDVEQEMTRRETIRKALEVAAVEAIRKP